MAAGTCSVARPLRGEQPSASPSPGLLLKRAGTTASVPLSAQLANQARLVCSVNLLTQQKTPNPPTAATRGADAGGEGSRCYPRTLTVWEAVHDFGSPPSSEAQRVPMSCHADTAVADDRVSVRHPRGSPDDGQFRRFRVAEDNSACNTRRRLEISRDLGNQVRYLPDHPRILPPSCVTVCNNKRASSAGTPALASQSPARPDTIAEMHKTVPEPA